MVLLCPCIEMLMLVPDAYGLIVSSRSCGCDGNYACSAAWVVNLQECAGAERGAFVTVGPV